MRFAVPVVLGVIAVTGCEAVLGLHQVTRPPVDPCVDPFAHYTFNGAVPSDVSGNAYKGTVGMPGPSLVEGHAGSAYEFNGTSTVSLAWPDAFQVTPLTVSLWIRPEDTADNECFINQLFATGGSSYDDSWQLCLVRDQLELIGRGDANWMVGAVNQNMWQHIALVLDGSNATVWLNGSASGSAFALTYDTVSPILLGADIDQGSTLVAAYLGAIDELQFFQCAVPAEGLGDL